jgi:hypothetical protein
MVPQSRLVSCTEYVSLFHTFFLCVCKADTSQIAPLQPRHKQTDKGLRDLRNENIALKYENSTLLSAKRKLEIRAALAESQTQELESLKNDMEGLRENLKMETEAKRLEANARLSESTKRKEAEAELDRLIQQQIDLAASYKRND